MKKLTIESILNELDYGRTYTKHEIWNMLNSIPHQKNYLNKNIDSITTIKSSNKAYDVDVILEENGRLILECNNNVISIDKQEVEQLLNLLAT